MSDFRTMQGVVGTSVKTDGEENPLRLCKKRGGVVAQQLHGTYYEAAARGRVLSAIGIQQIEISGTIASCVMYNPPYSNRLVNVIKLEMSVGQLPVNPIVGIYGVYASTLVPTLTNASVVSAQSVMIGTAADSVAQFILGSNVSFSTAPKLIRLLETKLTGTSTTIPFMINFVANNFLLAPNASLSIQQNNTDGMGGQDSAFAEFFCLWEEIPI